MFTVQELATLLQEFESRTPQEIIQREAGTVVNAQVVGLGVEKWNAVCIRICSNIRIYPKCKQNLEWKSKKQVTDEKSPYLCSSVVK